MELSKVQENWPQWSTPQREIQILRAALHAMARDVINGTSPPDYVSKTVQDHVDYYVSQERKKE